MRRIPASHTRLRSGPVWYNASYIRILSIGVALDAEAVDASSELMEALDQVPEESTGRGTTFEC